MHFKSPYKLGRMSSPKVFLLSLNWTPNLGGNNDATHGTRPFMIWVFLESLRVGFGFSTISLRNNIFSTKQHDSLRFLYETTFSLRNNTFSPKQHFLYETTCSLRNNILSAKQHVLYETKIFSTKLHNKYQYNLIYHLASSTEKEVLKVVFKVSKEVSKVSECFKKNIVVSKRTVLLRKVVCCRFLCEFHTGCFKNAQFMIHLRHLELKVRYNCNLNNNA